MGHIGYKGKKINNIKYKTQFDEIAPGLYKYYLALCDISHGAISSHLLKTDLSNNTNQLDNGIAFKPEESTYVINQFLIYLLAHIEFMKWIFPEIGRNRSLDYTKKEEETLKFLRLVMGNMSKNDKMKDWYNAVKQLINT